jgi:hypothetical protein
MTQPEGESRNYGWAYFHWRSDPAAAQLPHRDWSPKSAFAGVVHRAMKLPTFEAALTRQFRFVSTVTILQQTILPVFAGELTCGLPVGHAMQESQEIQRESQVGRLPKSWANAGAFSLLTRKSKLAQY